MTSGHTVLTVHPIAFGGTPGANLCVCEAGRLAAGPPLSDRKDLTVWPDVISGMDSAIGALKVFDRMFSGEANAWMGRGG